MQGCHFHSLDLQRENKVWDKFPAMSSSQNIKRDFKSIESSKEISKPALKLAREPNASTVSSPWFCFKVSLTVLGFMPASLVPVLMTATVNSTYLWCPGTVTLLLLSSEAWFLSRTLPVDQQINHLIPMNSVYHLAKHMERNGGANAQQQIAQYFEDVA